MKNSKYSWFEDKSSRGKLKSEFFKKKSHNYSLLRVVLFISFVTLTIVSIYFRNMYMLIFGAIGFLAIFGLVVKLHQSILSKKRYFDILSQMNDQEMARLKLELNFLSGGEVFQHLDHHYSHDLDLFGQHSLFQWLNRTVTPGGRDLLAKSMLSKSPKKVIQQRQQAVVELKEQPEWMQDFLAAGMAYHRPDTDLDPLLKWVGDVNRPNIPFWYYWALAILPVVTVGLTVAYFAGALNFMLLLPLLVLNGLILYRVQPQSKDTFQSTRESIMVLSAYSAMIWQVEKSDFKDSLLTKLQEPFLNKIYQASAAIKQLKSILSRIETRQNFFYWTFNILFLLDLIWLIQAASWKKKYHSFVPHWFEAIHNYELLTSLALSSFAHPHWALPVIHDDPFHFQATGLGHPLLTAEERVTNDFKLTNQGSIAVLTGSNMSGKSTFLRTIGINAVLASMGSVCCAKSLHLGTFNLFTSMRTTDSLEEHVSSFYAELRRLNQLIVSLRAKEPTLFLLDEVLKGTNSADRHLGATALIKQLHEATAFGVVSTHDLALGKLAEKISGIRNFSFNSKLQDGKLVFDYRLSNGICQSFNASELMAQMGIAMEKAQDS